MPQNAPDLLVFSLHQHNYHHFYHRGKICSEQEWEV
ncbi:hypothetical protein D0Y98_22510 [Escherichia coli]|nr:hypothetical protein [Escherichia coli]